VRETLWQAAHLVMPWSTPIAQKRDKIQSMISALGLDACADTKVGLPFVFRGLSGGQLKRLSIAVELLSDPSLLICDEPTSSLDSKAAEQVMLYLSKIARTKNITVISTLHQPSTKIW
jgi:ABC-type multidrug transport system ATPase subunit